MDIPQWMKICVAIAQICTPFLAFAVFIVTVMLAARSKQADILIECHRRHTDLVAKEHALRRRTDESRGPDAAKYQPEIDEWFGLFWRQQDDQFAHWQNGLIEDYIYADWNKGRLRDFRKNPPFLGNTGYKAGYEAVKGAWCSEGFRAFINELLNSGDSDATVHARRPRGIRVMIIRVLCGNRETRGPIKVVPAAN
jgi:hypothetical protein